MVSMWLNCSYQAMIINPFDPFNAIHMSIVRTITDIYIYMIIYDVLTITDITM